MSAVPVAPPEGLLGSGVPPLRRIRRYVAVARAAPPIVEAYVSLVRAEAALASDSLKPLLICLAILILGLIVTISVLVSGAMIALRESGVGLGLAIALPALGAVVISAIAATVGYRYLRRSLFGESRKRLSWLVETLYD